MASLDEIELTVDKLVAGGDGFGRYEGIAILVPGVAPGEKIRARLVERHPDYARAEMIEILEQSPMRRAAPCPYYGECGGCDLQHLSEEDQIATKVAAARETLKRLGGIALESLPGGEPEVHTADPWHYRMRAQFQVAEGVGGRKVVGFHARKSKKVVPIDRCAVLAPELEEVLRELPDRLAEPSPSRIDVAIGSDGSWGCAPVIEGLPHGELELSVSGCTLAFDARCFMQGHRGLIETLVSVAVGNTPQGSRGTFVDLYAGVGLFSVTLGRLYDRVVAVESERVSVHYAKRNLKRNGIREYLVVPRRVETWIPEFEEGATRILVDPPRTGLPTRVRWALSAKPPAWLTYVSCHPATLARDLKDLSEVFVIESLAFLDLFPQTSHLETVVQLRRREKGAEMR